MENKSHNEISADEYRKIISEIDSLASKESVKRLGKDSKTIEKKLIETLKKLIDMSPKTDRKDFSIDFINQFLTLDWGRSIVYNYSEGAEKFIKSEYLSNYFKQKLKNMFVEMDNIAGDR